MWSKKCDENTIEGQRVQGKRKAQGERDGCWFSRTECNAILRVPPHLKEPGTVYHMAGRGILKRLEFAGGERTFLRETASFPM